MNSWLVDLGPESRLGSFKFIRHALKEIPTQKDRFFILEKRASGRELQFKRLGIASEVRPINNFQCQVTLEESHLELPEGSGNLDALWMTFSSADRDSLKKIARLKSNNLVQLSAGGANAIISWREFPIATTIWLLRRHVGVSLDDLLNKIFLPVKIKGIERWWRLFRELIDEINQELMAPAFWANEGNNKFDSLSARVSGRDAIHEGGIFTLRGSRGVRDAGPARLGEEFDFSAAGIVAEDWSITRDAKGRIQSDLLTEIARIAIDAQAKIVGRRFPEFPGGLYDEL